MFSICIPAYNRAHHLRALLDSILSQGCRDFEVVICEDNSRERDQIAAIVREYESRYPGVLRYFENEINLGYDANIRNLVQEASGRFCFFMGNDDIMCPDALKTVADVIHRHPNVGMVVKSYVCFENGTEKVLHEIRYFTEETEIAAGAPAIRFAFRRSGVISGYIIDRDAAYEAATSKFDGTLYYQMHLTASVLVDKVAVVTPKVLVRCRSGEHPDFGNSANEKGKYVPGQYTPQARLRMVGGALSIIQELKETRGIDLVPDVVRDYANYFYPYIKDQLTLPPGEFYRLYRDFGRMGFRKYPRFHMYFILGYLLGEKRFDALIDGIRRRLGRSPRF
jgi:abequosyltransferase